MSFAGKPIIWAFPVLMVQMCGLLCTPALVFLGPTARSKAAHRMHDLNPEPPSLRLLSDVPADGPNSDYRDSLFKLLVNSVRDYAIFALDPTGHIMTWNEGAQRNKGYTAEEIIGKHFSIFYEDDARASNHPQYELEQATAHGRYEEEGWRVRKDGTKFWANVVITALWVDGHLVGFAKVTRDLTDRKRLEEEKERHALALQETNEELQRLAYVVSHELQAPIATITRYCNLFSVRYRDRLGDDANDFLDKMGSSARLIGHMVDDLWTYARTSKPGTAQDTVSLNHALSDALDEIKGSEKYELTSDRLPTIKGNRRQLTYLFHELISNSIRYRGPAEPKVHISAEETADGYNISVKDNGIGIDPVYSNDVFKLFHRLQGGPDADATGMGLPICRKIVQQHNGRMWFDSEFGAGTTFHIWLPKQR